jgi:hypothetical protein
MALVVKPSAVIKAVWFSIGTGAAYAAYLKLHKDFWSGAKQVRTNSYTQNIAAVPEAWHLA